MKNRFALLKTAFYSIRMDELNAIVSKNLTSLRKERKLTQQEFAEMIGYSDKSVSKWEMGKAIPSADILLKIADFYGITVDALLHDGIKLPKNPSEVDKTKNTNKIVICCLSGMFFLLVATCVFVNGVITYGCYDYWIGFVWCIPAVGLIDGFLVKRFWGKGLAEMILFSAFIWGLLFSFSLTFYLYAEQNIFFILFVGIPLQASLFLYEKIKK